MEAPILVEKIFLFCIYRFLFGTLIILRLIIERKQQDKTAIGESFNMNQDTLCKILEKYLHSPKVEFEDKENLITHVVADYMYWLMNKGGMVESKLDEIEVDLREEVRELISKKIYGYHSLKNYRDNFTKATK